MENTVPQEQEVENNENLSPQAENPSAEVPPQTKPAGPEAVTKLQAELAEAKDKYLRLYAEFENFRKRSIKEKGDLIFSAGEQVLKTLLPIADDFERAEKSFKDKSAKEAEGFFLIQAKFKKVLEQNGVKSMETALAEFNPDLHEAITQVPAPEESQKGKIIDAVEKGYMLGEKVLRHAKVVVGA